MKYKNGNIGVEIPMSPSMRREWIEIIWYGEKLPWVGSLPPCGGSGLKYVTIAGLPKDDMSPSMRREWIEIVSTISFTIL